MIVFIILLSFLNLYAFENINPEEQLCADLTIDAAVAADDGNSYVFKGESYWTLNGKEGVKPEPGNWITDRWPGLPTPIDAAFTIDEEKYRISTVFIKGNQWFLYKESKQLVNGTTEDWSYFPKGQIMAAFDFVNASLARKDYFIFFLYNQDEFSLYSIQSIQNPKHIANNKAYRIGLFMYFILLPEAKIPPRQITIKDYMNVTAVISTKEDLIFFGAKTLCKSNNSDPDHRCPKINGSELESFYSCPRELRPTTIAIITTTPLIPTANERTELTEGITASGGISQSGPTAFGLNPGLSPTDESKSSDKTFIFVLIAIICMICVIAFAVIFFAFRKHKKESTVKRSDSKSSSDKPIDKPKHKSVKRTDSMESIGTALKRGRSSLIDEDSQQPESYEANQLYAESKDKPIKKRDAVLTDSEETLGQTLKKSNNPLSDKSPQVDSNAEEGDDLIQRMKSKDYF